MRCRRSVAHFAMKAIEAVLSGAEALDENDAEHVVKGSFYRSRRPIRQTTLAGGGLTGAAPGRRDPTSVNNIGPPAPTRPRRTCPGSTLSRKRHASGAGDAPLGWFAKKSAAREGVAAFLGLP